ncbi:MAG: PQQ-binding-like beta-propeller repeat protein [Planctomycetaceae bacterium]
MLHLSFTYFDCHRTRPQKCKLPYLLLLLSAQLTDSLRAEDGWPFVRGPNFDGHSAEAGLVNSWPADGPPVLWTRKLGQGYSALVASGDRVYTQAQNMTGQYLYCLEADTGQTIWEYRYDWPYEAAGVYPGPRSTPTLYEGRVYFTSPDGLLGCIDQDDGRLLWSVDLLEIYGIEGCDFGYACSPTLIDGKVILPVGGHDAGVVAFDAESGDELWKSTSEPASYTPAYPILLNGERLVVCYMQNAMVILNRETGQLRRTVELSRGYDEHSAWPIYHEPMLWLSGPFRAGSYVLDLTGLDATETELSTVWRSKVLSNDVCSSVLVDGHLYGFDIFDVQSKTHRPSRGIFRCVEFSTGVEKWSFGNGQPRRTGNADDFANDIGQSGIIVADGKLIILNELGELILLQVNSQQCVELARCDLLSGELTWTPPCLHRSRFYVRNQSQAVCVFLGDPDQLPAEIKMRAGDLPQRQYYNMAAVILAVEPEYAFDIPHDRWLVQWFGAGVALLLLGKMLAGFLRRSGNSKLQSPGVEFALVTILGACGTTVLGHLTGEFVFTWPVCLYAALEFVAHSPVADPGQRGLRQSVRRRIPLVAFLLVSAAYFLACRRLSLVFEWAFLTGYVGALPVVWGAHRIKRFAAAGSFCQLFISLLGFTCFFTTAVVFLMSRY